MEDANIVEKIRIGIVGIGNCASSLIQGIEYYRHRNENETIGFMHWDIGGYKPCDIEVVAAIDAIRCCKLALDRRKNGGILYSPSAYFMKHPPKQFTDGEAQRMTEEFIAGYRED